MKLLKLILSLVASFSAATIGSLATFPNIPSWYAALEKPFFTPPNWIFGPVWTLLYIAMAVALFLVWTSAGKGKRSAFIAFGVQLALNALWSVVFFGFHQPGWAVVVIIGLLLAIAVTMRLFWQYSRLAVYLLIPYVAWVSFATALTVGIAVLNS